MIYNKVFNYLGVYSKKKKKNFIKYVIVRKPLLMVVSYNKNVQIIAVMATIKIKEENH
jgi:hypothetical protein